MSKILLLDGEGVQVVCMARELNKLGHELTALCAQKVSSGYATKYLHHKYKSPNVHLEAKAFKTYFYEHLKQHQYDLIIPMGDESAYFLSCEKEKVEHQYKYCVRWKLIQLLNWLMTSKNLWRYVKSMTLCIHIQGFCPQ